MSQNIEDYAEYFLEVSSEQRLKIIQLLNDKEYKLSELAKKLEVFHTLQNKMDKLSGGELQRIAILAASLGNADIYFFDEPLAYLDIGQRLKVSEFIRELSKEKMIIVVEHDLLLLRSEEHTSELQSP